MNEHDPPQMVIGVAWYLAKDWDDMRDLCSDRDEMHGSFEAWQRAAKQTERTLTAEGRTIVRVTIDPAEFAGWCAVRGRSMNGEARAEFVTEKARQARR